MAAALRVAAVFLAEHGLAGATVVGCVALTGGLVLQITNEEDSTVVLDRNFYGALALKERDEGNEIHRLALTHGRIRHGSQLARFPSWPTEYYGPETGVALAIQLHPRRADTTRQFRLGMVRLGVGTTAAYATRTSMPMRTTSRMSRFARTVSLITSGSTS